MSLEAISFFETAGFSMWPFIKQGERLIIKKIPVENLKIGDIILYQKDNQFVCHRLLRLVKHKNKYLLYTRGDNSNSSLEPINEQMFLGKAMGIIKNGKTISLIGRRQFINQAIVIIAPLINMGIRISKVLLRKK